VVLSVPDAVSEPRGGGWIDALARVCGVLLGSPRFKTQLRAALRAIDPDAAPELARVLLRADPEVPLAALAALPAALNILIELARAAAREASSLPVATLRAAVESMHRGLRGEALGELAARALILALRLRPPSGEPASTPAAAARGLRETLRAEAGLSPLEAVGALALPVLRLLLDAVEAALADPRVARAAGELLDQHPRVRALLAGGLVPEERS